MKVLIIEDELLVAKVYSIILEKNGYSTKVSPVITDLEKIISEFSPDVIILDNQLKYQQSGFQAAVMLREKGINIPIIFTTGNSESLAKDFTSKVNNAIYKIKPVDSYEILKEINSLIQNKNI